MQPNSAVLGMSLIYHSMHGNNERARRIQEVLVETTLSYEVPKPLRNYIIHVTINPITRDYWTSLF